MMFRRRTEDIGTVQEGIELLNRSLATTQSNVLGSKQVKLYIMQINITENKT